MPAPTKPVRLSLDQAAGEFDIDAKTLRKRLRTAGIEVGGDRKYTIMDVAKAVFGDLRGEQTRLAKENADKIALQNEKDRGRLLDADFVYKHYEGAFVVLRQKILASTMTDDEKDELLNELRGLKTRILPD